MIALFEEIFMKRMALRHRSCKKGQEILPLAWLSDSQVATIWHSKQLNKCARLKAAENRPTILFDEKMTDCVCTRV